MRLKRFGLAVSAAALVAAGQARAGEKVLFGPPPTWVVTHPPAAAPSKPGDLPVEIVQLDNQAHVEGEVETTYTAVSLKFLKPEGLQAGNLAFSWEPETEDFTVHRVVIHRGDKAIDVLAAGQTFTVMRREQDLEQATLTGMLTASLIPEGLQVGDVLEVASTKVSRNPVTGAHAEDVLGPLNIAAGRIDVSFEWPQGKAVRLAESPDLPPWTRTAKGGFERAAISLENVQPLIPPSGAPSRYEVLRMAEATDYASWGEVAELFVPLYAKASKIPVDGPLRVELEKIRAASKDPAKRAEGALQLVESRIRYVALEMGSGGLVPADAADTWARRYGDCKAKTALLLGLLHELGVEAEPVVVNATFGDGVNERLPAVELFNHILVHATIAGKTYWLDGTRTGDTSLAKLTIPNFGWGLPIRKGVTALVRMLPTPLVEPDSEMAIELDASKGIRAPVPAKLELILRGDDALGTNQALTSLAGSAHDEALRKFWRGRFDFIDPQIYDTAFDPDKVELHMTMQGTATLDWKDGWYETDETGVGFHPDFSRAAGPGHDAPFAVNYPYFSHTRETILLPPGFTGEVTSDGTEVDETIAGIEYHRHASLTGNRFVVERSSRSLVPEISFKDATAAAKRLRDLSQNSVYLRVPESYRPTASDLALLTATPSDDPAELLAQGEALENAGRYADALPKFTHATELDPKNATAWADRAFADTQVGQFDDAVSSNKHAAGLDPKNLVMLNTRGSIDQLKHKPQAALDDFEAVLKLYPDNTFAAAHRAMALADVGRTKEALAAADELISRHPAEIDNYTMKVFLLSRQQDRAAVEKTIDAMVAANRGNAATISMAVELYTEFGLAEKARAAVASGTDSAPTAMSLYNKARVRDSSDTQGRLADLDEALRLDPHFAPALLLRAQTRDALGKRKEALVDVEEALRASPSFSAALRERASLLASLDRTPEAIEQIDKAIALTPQDLSLYLQKANLLRNAGRQDEAMKTAADMVAVSPQETFAHVAAAKIYDAFGERPKALAEIDRALAIRPEAYIYLNRANVLSADDLDGRLADTEKALKLDPDLTEALTFKADLLARKGDHSGAAKMYDPIIAKEPNNGGYLAQRGIQRWLAGQRDEAQRDFVAARSKAVGATGLNDLCYQEAVAGVVLDQALDECQEALRLEPNSAPTLDSRATVYLQMGRFQEAKADYDRALASVPTMAPSLLGRAVARFHLGDAAGARMDLAAARKQEKNIVERFTNLGIAIPPELLQ